MKHLKKQYPQISEEEWNSFYEEVRRILFYYPTKDRRIWKESYKLYRKFYAEGKKADESRNAAASKIYLLH